MDSRNRVSAMVETALITAIAVIFTLAGIYIPLLSYALLLIPVPFIVIGAKHGLKYNILSVIAASLIIGSFAGPMRAIFISIFGGISSVVMGYMIEKKRGFQQTTIFGSIATLIASIIYISLMTYISGINIVEMIEQSFTLGAEFNENLYGALGTDPAKLEEMKEMLDHLRRMTILLLPSSIVFGSVLFTYLNYFVSGAVLKRIGNPIEKPGKFSEFRLPRHILMGSLLIVALSYIVGSLNLVNFESLFTNVFYLFFIVYLIQGLAVVSFFIERRGFAKGLRIFILIFLLLLPNMAIILMFIGLFDVIFNLRKLEK